MNTFKHKKALRQEIIAGKALISKKSTAKVTLHFYTTQRSRISGDWPSLILNFNDDDPLECRMVSLRPIKMAYEGRAQTISLVVGFRDSAETECRGQHIVSHSVRLCVTHIYF